MSVTKIRKAIESAEQRLLSARTSDDAGYRAYNRLAVRVDRVRHKLAAKEQR